MQAWLNFLNLQEADLGAETVHKWLRSLKVVRYDACNLYLEAKDSFQALWFEEHIRQKAQTKLVNNNNKKIKVHLSIFNSGTDGTPSKKSRGKTEKKKEEPAAPKCAPSFEELDPYCRFERFVVCPGNLLPYKLLCQLTGYTPETEAFSSPQLGNFNPIYLYGAGGTGKTHLLTSVAHALRQAQLKALYVRAEAFTEHVVTAIRSGEMSLFRQAYRNIDVLIVDDVHVFSRKGATQEEFFHTFNTLHVENKQIILSANAAPSELQAIEPRLISRFEWGIVLPLESLSQEDMSCVLQKKAEALNFSLHPKVSNFLIETFTSGGTALTRALEALILRAHLAQTAGKLAYAPITAAIAKNLLSDLIAEESQAAVTPEKIIQATAEHYGIRMEDIIGKSQSRECVIPRQMAMHICRSYLKIPYAKIGALFSKDHSTVISSVKVVQKGLHEKDPDASGAFHTILKRIKS